MVDILIQAINSCIAFLLSRTLIPNGQNQTLHSISYCLSVGGKQLPHGWVIRINHQVLSTSQQAVAGGVNILACLDNRLLGFAGLSADLGRGGGKLRAGGEGSESLYCLHKRLGGLSTRPAVRLTQVTGKGLEGGERERGGGGVCLNIL